MWHHPLQDVCAGRDQKRLDDSRGVNSHGWKMLLWFCLASKRQTKILIQYALLANKGLTMMMIMMMM